MNKGLLRTRWAALGAAVAVSLGGGAMWMVDAAPAGSGVEFVAITPCRLLATRPAPSTVGARSAPLGAAEAWAAAVWGTNGNCTIPATATAVSLNVTALAGTATSNLTVYPADAGRPGTSNLNWRAGDGPTPNAVTVGLSATGSIGIYNAAGTVQVIVDIVGYYKTESKPAQIVTVAKSGGDFTTLTAAMASITDASVDKPYLIEVAPGTYTEPAGVDLKSYVDIRGSGTGITTIACSCASNVDPVTAATGSAGAVFRAKGWVVATLSDMTLNNTGDGAWGDGVDVVNPAPSRANVVLRNLVVETRNSSNSVGIYVVDAVVTVDRSSVLSVADATGGGIGAAVAATAAADVIVVDSDIVGGVGASVSAGVYMVGAQVSIIRSDVDSIFGNNGYGVLALQGDFNNFLEVRDSKLRGSTNSVNVAASIDLLIVGGLLDGPVGGLGTFHCGGVLKYPALSTLSSACT